ncbi:MAG TPA: hypothetical protein ENN79_04205 [Desulfobacteraceae bacterium]|nr:hypothetical protein [Desulfobacteraceae bacterium]
MVGSRLARILPLTILLGGLCIGILNRAEAQDTTPPTVVSAYPANGAANVNGKLRTVSVTFSEPMDKSYISFNYDGENWGLSSQSWSDDGTVFYITRDTNHIIDDEITISFVLNPPGHENDFRDKAGNHLATYPVSFTIGADETPPTVVSTYPASGATGIDPYFDTIIITFSEAMVEDFSIQNSGSWGRSEHTASTDMRLLYMTRVNAGTPLPQGETVFVTLNPDCAGRFRDLAGNPLEKHTFTFTVGTLGDRPSVVSTNPASGELNVGMDLEYVSITFDKPMKSSHSIFSNFPPYDLSWSSDQQTVTLSRRDLSTPLFADAIYFFTLNKDGVTSFQDLSGAPLEEYSFSFTTAMNYQLHKFPANAIKGFKWPYYLSIPNNLGRNTVLLVETNNTGNVNDDWAVHDQSAENLAKWRSNFAMDLDVPLLVPTFPRPSGTDIYPPLWLIYTHALDRDCLTTTSEGLERIDLQLIAMVDDAKARLRSMGYTVAEKIFINGYSASGSFANRFTLLHPEIIQAMASGSPGGWPTVPVSTWNNETLRYPVGIADLENLIGEPFNLAAFRLVPQYIYVGDKDYNDAVDYRDGFDPEDEELVNRLFGDGEPYIVERWPHAEAIFDSVQSSAQFVIYAGVEHTITQAMFGDLLGFFQNYHPGRFELSHSILALQIAAGMDLDGAYSVLDISGDGKIGIEEAVYALQMVADLR